MRSTKGVPPQVLVHNLDGQTLLAKMDSLEKRLTALYEKIAPPSDVEFLTVRETADVLQVSRVTVYTWISKGILISYRIGNQTRLKRHEIEEALTSTRKQKGGSHE